LISRPEAPPAIWAAERGDPVPPGARTVPLGSADWSEALTTSRWVVTNDDLPAWFTPGPGQVVLRLAGGWPIARGGLRAHAHPLGKVLVDQVTADAAKWTALASPGPSATPILRAEFGFEGEVLEAGRPGDDLLTTGDAETARVEVVRRLGLPADTRLILYAPTRRPMDLRKRGWSDPGRLLDLPRVAAGLPPGHVLLARRHPAVPDDVVGAPDVSGYPRVAELLLAADVLITDYSTLIADFAGTGRPILLHVPDLTEFAASPGLNVDLAAAAPGPLLHTADEVLTALRAAKSGTAPDFARDHAVSGGGRAAAAIVDWLLDKNSGRL
jgi:CDP-glycerol glycerophosphotransferase